MATWCLSEASHTSGYDDNTHILQLRWHEPSSSTGRGVIIGSTETILDASSEATASLPPLAVTKRDRKGTQSASSGLCMYREQLIKLYWVQDLPLREVQEIMKREHGLDVR